jgi:hypothetical protein
VTALRAGIREHLPLPHTFVCLSDDPSVPGYVPLRHEWKGWWAKIEALSLPASYGHVLLMDLDTLPIGDLSEIASYRGEFAMIADLGRGRGLQSGVMAFRAGGCAARLYDVFRERADEWMQRYRGDGEWLNAHADVPDVLQDLYPDQICSYKWQCRHDRPEGPALVCGHGPPRFSDPAAMWAHKLWRRRAA